ncbi:MAG: zinc-dependent alcohol dehydrogenase family protein [Candidatus Bipolaricaulota bacterium]|nr:zinc-dependent alcohol dehydrogenase family protein [Candidatus Bipolaricaulota bacterium]MDW8141629.1 zinc-dependent alcohol dehydrogenase family protein [Candidatus Bipolaricaulota bacterium]
MKAMVLKQLARLEENSTPLELETLPDRVPREREILIKISACGICHTELDEIEGRTTPSRFPIILGHQVVGRVVALGPGVRAFKVGDRVGVAWIFSACGRCKFCLRGEENLCYDFRATGRDAHGGYAEYMTVSEEFAYPISEVFSDVEAAPLLCAGAIGYRSLRLTNLQDGQNLGLTGFGASAHLVLQLVRTLYPNTKIFVFARSETERAFARQLGALWAGDIGEESPEKLDAIIDTTPVWRPVVESLKNLERGGRIVINAIRKEDTDKSTLAQLDYEMHLWLEKEIKSVANVTRRDVREFLELAAKIPIKPEVQIYKLEEANQALLDLKARKIRGAKVLTIE